MKIRRKLFATGGRAGGRAVVPFGAARPRTIAKKTTTGYGGKKPPSNRRKPTKLRPAGERRRFNLDFDAIHKIVMDLNKKRSLKKGNMEASREKFHNEGGSTHGEEITIQTESSKTTMPNVIGQGVIVKNKNEMTTGSPTVKGIRMLEKIAGTMTRVMWDSKLYGTSQGNYSQVDRRQLNHSHGFNTKNWWVMPGCAAPGYLDMLDTILNNQKATTQNNAKIAIASYCDGRTSSIADERKYASFKDFKVEMCFTNESNFLPVKLKLHYIMPKNDVRKQDDQETNTVRAGYLYDFANFVMNNDGVYTNQKDNAIPIRYQLSGPDFAGQREVVTSVAGATVKTLEGDNYRNYSGDWQVAIKANPNMSPYFRENFEIVRTFSRTLDPNDVWNFTHKHNFGAGLELDQMKQAFLSMNQNTGFGNASYTRVGNDRPIVGFWLVESMGVPCTCLIADKNTAPTGGELFPNPYAGTSNGSYHCEIKSSLTYMQPLSNAASAGALTGTEGQLEFVHMRVFKKRDFVVQDSRNVRHVLPAFMVTDRDDLTENKGIISVYTEAALQTAGDREYKS